MLVFLLKHKKLLAKMLVVSSTLVFIGVGCGTDVRRLGVHISGTVTIPAELKPLLPKEAGGETINVQDTEPNGYPLPAGTPKGTPDYQELDAPIAMDGPNVVMSGTMNIAEPKDERDRYVFFVDRPGSVSILLQHACEDSGSYLWFVKGRSIADDASNALATENVVGNNSDEDQIIISSVVEPNTAYMIHLKYFTGALCDYTITVVAQGGTVVGRILIGAFSTGQPFRIDDPISNNQVGTINSSLPVAGTEAEDFVIDEAGNLTARFAGVYIQPTTTVYLFAFADNDSSNVASNAGLNFTINGPPNSADFIMSQSIKAQVGKKDILGLALVLDRKVLDSDYDGLTDHDQDGDGMPDDNCPYAFNPNQKDQDHDLIGDVCDNCPDVANYSQTNSDGHGKGDACNAEDEQSKACAYMFLRSMDDCSFDSDGDEIEDYFLECPDEKAVCDLSELKKMALDNCPDVENPDQADLDADAIDEAGVLIKGGGGDACDTDDDNDGIIDDNDVCPFLADDIGQQDTDKDGWGDACDNCPKVLNPTQEDLDGDTFGDACDPDDDGDGFCDLGETGDDNNPCVGEDTCPFIGNPDQPETYGDGGDGYDYACDNCPLKQNPTQDDVDKDGIGDACDNCVNIANSDQSDIDHDNFGDACDPDDDGDGYCDPGESSNTDNPCQGVDNCPYVTNSTQSDSDNDLLGDVCDNCTFNKNDEQLDWDGDGIGDACEIGTCEFVSNPRPNCDPRYNDEDTGKNDDCVGAGDICVALSIDTGMCKTPLDIDADGKPDACDPDDDGDGICDPGVVRPDCVDNDNCPEISNADQADIDADLIGDICDNDTDPDGDESLAEKDSCPFVANPGQEDKDNDGVGDACDNCLSIANARLSCESDLDCENHGGTCRWGRCDGQADKDNDGIGDACDNCRDVSNSSQINTDDDQLGDICDTDDDNDGIVDSTDVCPLHKNEDLTDDDDDTILNLCDNCVDIQNPGQIDTDKDGIGDACDNCLFTPNPNQNPGACAGGGMIVPEDEGTNGNDVTATAQSLGPLVPGQPYVVMGQVSVADPTCSWYPEIFFESFEGDADFYTFQVVHDGQLTLQLDWAGEVTDDGTVYGNYDMVLFDGRGLILSSTASVLSWDGATNETRPEKLSGGFHDDNGNQVIAFTDVTAYAGESFYVVVVNCTPPIGNYRLGIGLREHEIEINNTFGFAQDLGDLIVDVPVNIAGTLTGTSACDWEAKFFNDELSTDDWDLFSFQVLQDGNLQAFLDWTDDNANLEFVIFDDRGILGNGSTETVLSFAGRTAKKPEHIPAVNLEAGKSYYMGVFHCTSSGNEPYRMNLTLERE